MPPAARPAQASVELCRFEGDTSFDGHASVLARVEQEGVHRRVDVQLRLDARFLLWRSRTLVEEISDWQGNVLQRVALNNRSLSGAHVVRQQWDLFERADGALQAWRIQGKTGADFERRHPGFATRWNPDQFGEPWLDSYVAGQPERRPDLDLPAPLPETLRTPLALAFLWDRLQPEGTVEVFLPGFKRDKLAELRLDDTSGADGTTVVHVSVRHPALATSDASWAQAVLSSQRQIQELQARLHARGLTAAASLRLAGCEEH